VHSPTWRSVETISWERMEQLQVDRLSDCVANVQKQVGSYRKPPNWDSTKRYQNTAKPISI